ncbi:MAG: zinc ribbon domain-containing protein [Candidatus Thorarchaeota archaeon]
MKKTLPRLLLTLFVTCVLWSVVVIPSPAQPADWSGNNELAFLLEINGVSITNSSVEQPIPVDLADDMTMELTIDVGADIHIYGATLVFEYLSIPVFNQPIPIDQSIIAPYVYSPLNDTYPLDSLIPGNGSLISGTISGSFSFTYALLSDMSNNKTVNDDFVLRIGPTGLAAVFSISGLITLGFTFMSIISILFSLDEFQQGILAARKMRRANSAADVGIFPRAVILRRKRQKESRETLSENEIVQLVSRAASKVWDGKRCPQCGKKWKSQLPSCKKCGIDREEARHHFSQDIAEHAPKALKAVPYGGKVTVGKFCKRVKLKPVKGGALAAALTEMKVFQTKDVNVPMRKLMFAGMTIAGIYLSWLQMLGGATPTLTDIAIMVAGGLVVSVLLALFMKWLAHIPPFGYD